MGTHLGTASFTGDTVLTIVGTPCFGRDGTSVGLLFTGIQGGTYVASDGSGLGFVLTFTGCLEFTQQTGQGFGTADADGTQLIVGGTGRFAGATGSATFTVTADLGAAPGTTIFTNSAIGTITF